MTQQRTFIDGGYKRALSYPETLVQSLGSSLTPCQLLLDIKQEANF